MAVKDVWKTLVLMDEHKANIIIDKAWARYVDFIGNIISDVYDSCIEDYYAQYMPTRYGRHGDITGFNLYRANDIEWDDLSFNIDVSFDPAKLLPYYDGKRRREKRDKVLNTVMAGFRGTKSRKTPPGWPRLWGTSYPNRYSKYSAWTSNGNTMDDIYFDLMDNLIKDTTDILKGYISELL
jgi:hypothetical protein